MDNEPTFSFDDDEEANDGFDFKTQDANASISANYFDGVNPEQHANALKPAEDNGVDTIAVLNDPKTYDFKPIDNISPATADLLMKPTQGSVMYQSADIFNGIEKQYEFNDNQEKVNYFKQFNDTDYKQKLKQEEISTAGYGIRESVILREQNKALEQSFIGNGTKELDQKIKTYDSLLKDTPEMNFLEETLKELIGEMSDVILDAIGAKYTTAVGGALMLAGKFIKPLKAATAIGKKVIGAGFMVEGAKQDTLQFYKELKDMKDADGKPMNHDVIRGASIAYGIPSIMLENLAEYTALGGKLPDGFFSKFSKKSFRDKLKQPTYRAALKKLGKNFTFGVGTEVMTEVLQQFMQDLVTNGALEYSSDENSWQEKDKVFLDEMIVNAGQAAKGGFQGSVGIQGASSAVRYGADVTNMINAQNELDSSDALIYRMGDEKARIAKSVGKEHSMAAADLNNKTGTVLIDREKLQKFFQTAEISEEEIMESMPDTYQAMQDSLDADNGQEIEIPTWEMAEIQMSELPAAEDIMMNYRKDANSQTRAEFIENEKNLQAFLDAQEQGDDIVYEDVFKQLTDAGMTTYAARQNALLWSSMAKAQAKAQNISVEEAYEGNRLDVSEEHVREANLQSNYERFDSLLDSIRKGKIPTSKSAYGRSVMEYLTSEGGLIDTGNELSNRDVGRVGNKNLIQPLEKGGITLDEAIERLIDSGHFTGESGQYTHEDVLTAIDDEMLGSPAYSPDMGDPEQAGLLEEMEYIQDTLLRMGLDTATMDNEQIKQALQNEILYQPAFHGTHAKDIQQFLTDYIGTGEGAQAYGWGMYFASDKDVAEWYRTGLAGGDVITIDGKEVTDNSEIFKGAGLLGRGYAGTALSRAEGDLPKAMDILAKNRKKAISKASSDKLVKIFGDAFDKARVALTALDGKEIKVIKQGQTYSVELKPTEEEYLLWDKPLTEQSQVIQDAIVSMGDAWALSGETGRSYYQKLQDLFTNKDNVPASGIKKAITEGQQAASVALLDAGVRGVKYVDGNTRNKDNKSFNYVIFDNEDVEITDTFYQKKATRTEQVGDLQYIQDNFPTQYEAITKQIDKLDDATAQTLRDNLKKYEKTAWSVVAYKSLVFREIFDRGFNGESFDDLNTPSFWSAAGKIDIMNYDMFRRFASGDKKEIELFGRGYNFFSDNAKAETDISGSFAACDPTQGCAATCYSATGTGGNFSAVAKSEFTEWMANNYIDELADQIGSYKNMPAGNEGYMLRLNERGDLTPAQLNLIKKLNAKGIRLQVFSKQPELLSQVPPENWRALSVDSTNIDKVMDYPDLDVALTLTEDFTPEMMYKIKDRLRVVLPLHTKRKDKVWTRKELFEKFPEAKKEIGKTLCPVIINGHKVDKKVQYQAILNSMKSEGSTEFWTCTTCDALGSKCFGADTKVKAEQKAKEYTVSISTIGGRKSGEQKAREKVIKGLEELFKSGAINEEQLGIFTKNVDEAITSTRTELDAIASQPIATGAYEASQQDAESRQRTGDLPEGKGTVEDDKLYQDEGAAKGYYERTPLRDVFKITLTGKADLSTFVHESGHAFLDMLIRDADKFDYASKELDTIMEWMGVDSPDQIQTEQHEKFARGFEAYLRDGKAPSIELREAFRNFKMWLTNIYKKFTQLDVELTPEVTGVMDRLLATQEQIEEARTAGGILPMYDEASQTDKTGMSKEDYDAYRKKYNNNMAAEMEKMDARRIKQYNKTIEFMNTKRRKEAKSQAAINLADTYRVELDIKNNKKFPTKDSVIRVFPDIPDRLKGLYRKESMIDADMLAREHGYTTGEDMLTEIANMPSYKDALITETTNILEEEYGEQEKLPTAKEVVHSDTMSDFIKSELISLGKRDGVVTQIKQVARTQISNTPINKIKPIVFERAERKASMAAAKALADGDRTLAALQKQKQLLNHHLFKEATKALREVDKWNKYLKKFTKKKVRGNVGKAGKQYLEAIDKILETIQLKKVSDKFIDKKKALTDYVKRIRADGVAVPDNLENLIKDKNYRELTYDEFEYAYQAVKQVASAAANKKKFIDRKNKRDLNAVTAEVSQSIRDNKIGKVTTNKTLEKVTSWIRKADSELVKFEFLTRWMDGGVISGKAWQTMFKPMQTAEEEFMEMNLKYTQDVIKIINGFGSKWKGSSKFLGKKMDKQEIIAIALNMGNEGNIQRLTDGYGWTVTQVQDELEKRLTTEDMDGIQQIWDTINELYKPMAEVAQRVEGEAPEKVVEVPFKFKGKKYSGGYYPAMYDPKTSSIGDKQELMTSENYISDGAKKASATKDRAAKVNGKILLDLNVIPRHVQETVFYITHYEAINNVHKVLIAQNVKDAIVEKYGIEYHTASRNWLNAIANQGNVYGKQGWWDGRFEWARGVTSLAAMGFSLPTMLVQPLGLLNTVNEVGAYHTTRAVMKIMANPVKQWKTLNQTYPEFNHLINQFDRDMKKNIDKQLNQNPVLKANSFIARNAFLHIGLVQKMVNMVTYTAAENKYMNDDTLTKSQAIDKCKAVVRMTQSMAGQKDLASVQNSPLMKLLTMFYSYFSALYAQGRGGMRRGGAKGVGEISIKAMEAAKMYTLLFALPAAIDTFMRDTCDDAEDEFACYTTQVALYTTAPLPIVRDLINSMATKFSYKITPIESMFVNATKVVKAIASGDEVESERVIKAIAPILGFPPKLITQPMSLFDEDVDEWREFLQLKRAE